MEIGLIDFVLERICVSYSACSTLNLVRALLCCRNFASSLSYAAKNVHISHDLCNGSFSRHNYWPAGIGVGIYDFV